MKIAIPTAEYPQDAVHGHVATAPFFTVVDLDSEQIDRVPNPLLGKETGEINPVGIVKDLRVDALICAYIGPWAVKLLEAAGIKVYKAHGGTVNRAVADFKEGRLKLLKNEQPE